VALIHATYGVAAAAIAVEDGPVHGPIARLWIVDPYDAAADCRSAANESQAAAAASIGPEPAPTYIRPELTSGGSAPKSNIYYLRFLACGGGVSGLSGRV
jgi:hypothetical protein